MEPPLWDAIVIGAGPAATAAAITGCSAGISCLVLDHATFPRWRPGETLHPGIEPLLSQLGVSLQVAELSRLKYRGITIRTPQGTRFEELGADEHGPWRGLQVCRSELDSTLLQRAQSLGATVRTQCRVKGLSRDLCGRVVGVETNAGPLFARFVIDAAGARHLAARSVGSSIIPHSPPLLARFGYAQGPLPCLEPQITFDESGWTWITPFQSDRVHWTRLDVRCGGQAGSSPQCRMADGLDRLSPMAPVRGADVTWRCVQDPAGPGYFISGDAACVLDPASSDGVIRALMSGISAGHLVHQVLEGTTTEQAAITAHTRWTKQLFEHEVRRLSAVYDEAFPRWRLP